MRQILAIPLTIFFLLTGSFAEARQWSDSTGRLKIDADFFAANEDTVVIKKRNGSLVGLEISQLSEADQLYVAEKRAELQSKTASSATDIETFQTWTSKGGFESRGRIIAFGRQQVTIQRIAGVVNVNGTAFSRLNAFYQHIVPKIVAQYEDPSVTDEKALERWLKEKGGNPPVFNVEGVLMKLEDGSELAVPFFLFSENDLEVLAPGWEQWKAAEASESERKREDFLMSVQADNYQQQQASQAAASQQIQMMQLQMLAVNAGVISIWEVIMRPADNVYHRTFSVMVPAANSEQARYAAFQQYPGYHLVGIRRASF
jgi:hypothetical protein